MADNYTIPTYDPFELASNFLWKVAAIRKELHYNLSNGITINKVTLPVKSSQLWYRLYVNLKRRLIKNRFLGYCRIHWLLYTAQWTIEKYRVRQWNVYYDRALINNQSKLLEFFLALQKCIYSEQLFHKFLAPTLFSA